MHEPAAQPDLAPAMLAVRVYDCASRRNLGPLATVPARLVHSLLNAAAR
jgi:hypothetical protein